jgi:lysophospholipase L1-like esterase
MHARYLARARRGGIDIVFLGDSITEAFATVGRDAWQQHIAPLGSAVNFGIGGDRTEFVLWRVRNGELDGTNARVVVVMIGTNNLETSSPADIARGVAAVVTSVRAKLPHAIVVLNALLPRGAPNDPLHSRLARANALIAHLADGRHVRWVDAGPRFLDAHGAIASGLSLDLLHPSAAGYAIWGTALDPVLRGALAK